MIQCKKCGTWAPDGTNYCPSCGSHLDAPQYGYDPELYSEEDIQQNRFMAVFSYLGILFLIPLIAGKHSPYVRFHANQGIVLFLTELIFNVCRSAVRIANHFSFIHFGWVLSILNVFSYVFLVLAIWGIINVCTGKAAKLPFIGEIRILR